MKLDELTFLDPAVQDCPFSAYEYLHEQAPVFFDRRAGFWVITRYDELLRRRRNIRLVPERNDFAHEPGLLLRAPKRLWIEFD
jgi:cytochrome P450